MTKTQRRIAEEVRREVARRWPMGVIPPREGGRFFRMMADRLDCTEWAISDLGEEEGWWPWSAEQVVRAFAKAEEEERKHRRQVKRGECKETWLPFSRC
jgi:hypothetical protein